MRRGRTGAFIPVVAWFPGFIFLTTVRLRGITPTHQHSRDIRSGQVHSCRTRRRHSWENRCTGRLWCTRRLRHRRHRRRTLEGEKYNCCEHPIKASSLYTKGNIDLGEATPSLTLAVGKGEVSWLAAVTSRTSDALTAQAPTWGIANGLHCPSVVTRALWKHTFHKHISVSVYDFLSHESAAIVCQTLQAEWPENRRISFVPLVKFPSESPQRLETQSANLCWHSFPNYKRGKQRPGLQGVCLNRNSIKTNNSFFCLDETRKGQIMKVPQLIIADLVFQEKVPADFSH